MWKVDVSDFRILLVMLYDPKVFCLASLLRLLLKTSLEKIVRVRILWASFFLSIMKLSCPCHRYFLNCTLACCWLLCGALSYKGLVS